VYGLENRLLRYAAMIIRLADGRPRTRAGLHISGQLLRSGTSPLANHGESESAESPEDLVHKFRICLKELRESMRWLRLIELLDMMRGRGGVREAIDETDQLIRIFVVSIRTAGKRKGINP